MSPRTFGAGMLLLAMAAPAAAGAQQADTTAAEAPAAVQSPLVQETPFQDASAFRPVSPGGAFWRSVLIPGWGHAAVGSYTRGAFYFGAATGTGYMLAKSLSGRATARRARDLQAETAGARLRHEGVAEDSIPLKVAEDEAVVAADALVSSRSQQVQDWAALGIFILLLSGADAFVSAHLMDFPEPLQVEVVPREQGRVEMRVEVMVGGGR